MIWRFRNIWLFPLPDTVYDGFTRASFSKILNLCTKDNLFLFNEQLYKQLDGAPMGGSISPTLANIFLCHHEENWINNCPPEFKPAFYRRYVDDTFVLFKDPLHIQPFLTYLYSQHSRMKFTVESEKNHSLPFLDINVVKHDDSFATDLYRKPTFTGLGCKFDSAINETYKTGLITCLIDRAYKISSSYWNDVKSFFKLSEGPFPNSQN